MGSSGDVTSGNRQRSGVQTVGGSGHDPRVAVWTLSKLELVVRDAWGPDTCDVADVDDWCPDNPARGQCGVTALVVRELIGGDVIRADVHRGSERVGGHYWNRLSGGVDVDLTREQFDDAEVVGSGWIVDVPPGPPRRCREQYELFRGRVLAALGITMPEAQAVKRSPSIGED
jgi:hypothetical protein